MMCGVCVVCGVCGVCYCLHSAPKSGCCKAKNGLLQGTEALQGANAAKEEYSQTLALRTCRRTGSGEKRSLTATVVPTARAHAALEPSRPPRSNSRRAAAPSEAVRVITETSARAASDDSASPRNPKVARSCNGAGDRV